MIPIFPARGPYQAAAASFCLSCLAWGVAHADPVHMPQSMLTSTHVQTRSGDVPDGDSSNDYPLQVESYSEYVKSKVRHGMASALAQDDGNIEVGAEGRFSFEVDSSTAYANMSWSLLNQSSKAMQLAWEIDAVPGEILFRSPGGIPPFLPRGKVDGRLDYKITAKTDSGPLITIRDCTLGIEFAMGVWSYAPVTNDCGALDWVGATWAGEGGQWGVTTRLLTSAFNLELQSMEAAEVSVTLMATTFSRLGDWSGFVSAKVGDPLSPGGGSVRVRNNNPVPEPGTGALLAIGLGALMWRQRAGRAGGRALRG